MSSGDTLFPGPGQTDEKEGFPVGGGWSVGVEEASSGITSVGSIKEAVNWQLLRASSYFSRAPSHLGRGVILQTLIGTSKAGVDLFPSVPELKGRGRSLKITCPLGDTDFSVPYLKAGRDWVSETV